MVKGGSNIEFISKNNDHSIKTVYIINKLYNRYLKIINLKNWLN